MLGILNLSGFYSLWYNTHYLYFTSFNLNYYVYSFIQCRRHNIILLSVSMYLRLIVSVVLESKCDALEVEV
jgi:hypothetical protein